MKDKKYQVWLGSLPGVGSTRFMALMKYFGSAKNVFESSKEQLVNCREIGEVTADIIFKNRDIEKIDRYLKKVQENEIKVYTMEEEAYPENLRNIFDPPPIIYVKGDLKKEDNLALGIVGSRKASEYGLKASEKIAEALAKLGITIISGMALGIDSAAHRGAIKAKGRTIAVFGCGLCNVYPTSNMNLYREILKNGAVISEYPIGEKAFPEHFPARNRIISGLSKGILVVEAGLKSGSLITTDFALEQGRDVFAIPGNIFSSNSKGTNNMIKNGAKLVDCIEDILEEWNLAPINEHLPVDNSELSSDEKAILNYFERGNFSIDELIECSKMAPNKIMAILTIMEINGLVQQISGRYYRISSNM